MGQSQRKENTPQIRFLKELLEVLQLEGPYEPLIHRGQSSQHVLLGLPGKGDCATTDQWELDRERDPSILGSRGAPAPHFSHTSYLILATPLTRDTQG